MAADNIVEKKEPERLPVWACIPLFIVVFFVCMGLYGILAQGFLSLVLGVEARHPGMVGYILLEGGLLLSLCSGWSGVRSPIWDCPSRGMPKGCGMVF